MHGSAGRPPRRATRQHQRQPEHDVIAIHVQPARRPKRAAAARNSAKKSDVRRPEVREGVLARDAEARTRARSKRPGCSRDDRTPSARATRRRVHPRDHDGDEHDPRELPRRRSRNQKPTAVSAAELREVEERLEPAPAQDEQRQRAPSATPTRESRARRATAARARRSANTAGITTTATKRDVGTRRHLRQRAAEGGVQRRRRRAGAARAATRSRAPSALVRRQLGPPGAERLEGVPEARSSRPARRATRRCRASTSASIVAVKRCSSPSSAARAGRRAGTRARSGTRRASLAHHDDELRLHDVQLARRARPRPARAPRSPNLRQFVP